MENKKETDIDAEVVKSASSAGHAAVGAAKGFLASRAAGWVVALVVLIVAIGIINRLGQRTGYHPADLAARPVATIDAMNAHQWGYAAGVTVGKNVKDLTSQIPNGETMDKSAFLRGLVDAIMGTDQWINDDQVKEVLDGQMVAAEERTKKEAADNKTASEAFLTTYAAQEGVKKLSGGTLYRVEKQGNGVLVGKNEALVHYKGTLVDGTEFDNSRNYGDEPVPMTADGTVPGFGEALSAMRVGDTWEIAVPADQAYGEMSNGKIGPNQALIFTVEVVDLAK